MIRGALFALFAAALVAYAFWIYLRVDLSVSAARGLAVVRALVLVVILALLFDVRIPTGTPGSATRWVLLDASTSMAATDGDGGTAWSAAVERADELASDGWHVVTFGGDPPRSAPSDPSPTELRSLLGPALRRAAEAGARTVTVLSDHRYEDGVAVRSALDGLPLEVTFEAFGADVDNVGVTRLEVSDFTQPNEPGSGTVEVHGGREGDTVTVEILEEGRVVAEARLPAPSPGLRSAIEVELPPPEGVGRLRYTAVVRSDGDGFPNDDAAVDYSVVGRQEGALVLLSLSPDWELRYLLPVLRDVTGLPTVGYLRAGPNRFVQAGRAADRAGPVDSVTVREAVTEAALVVAHGLSRETLDEWARHVIALPGRKILFVRDPDAATLAGVEAEPARPGEWYVGADVPVSPIAGALSGAPLQGLPPLTDLLVTDAPDASAPLRAQLRGAGAPVPALVLSDRPTGRVAIALAGGFWRWSVRDGAREAYRRMWSGVVGWLLADQSVLAAVPRPAEWVVPPGEPISWMLPVGTEGARLVVSRGDSVVADTLLSGSGTATSGRLPPGPYEYTVRAATGDTIASGRFDVAVPSEEMLPVAAEPPPSTRSPESESADLSSGRPVRTSPWPYLFVITLLCAEWVGRRRSGLR